MSRKIEAGETVEITALDSSSAWSDKEDKERFIGMKVKLVGYRKAAKGKGWKFIHFEASDNGSDICMLAKVRRIKK